MWDQRRHPIRVHQRSAQIKRGGFLSFSSSGTQDVSAVFWHLMNPICSRSSFLNPFCCVISVPLVWSCRPFVKLKECSGRANISISRSSSSTSSFGSTAGEGDGLEELEMVTPTYTQTEEFCWPFGRFKRHTAKKKQKNCISVTVKVTVYIISASLNLEYLRSKTAKELMMQCIYLVLYIYIIIW